MNLQICTDGLVGNLLCVTAKYALPCLSLINRQMSSCTPPDGEISVLQNRSMLHGSRRAALNGDLYISLYYKGQTGGHR